MRLHLSRNFGVFLKIQLKGRFVVLFCLLTSWIISQEVSIANLCYQKALLAHPGFANYDEELQGFWKFNPKSNADLIQKTKKRLLSLENDYQKDLENLRIQASLNISRFEDRKYQLDEQSPEKALLETADQINSQEVTYRLQALELKKTFEREKARLLQSIFLNREETDKLITKITSDIEQAINQVSQKHAISLVQNSCILEKKSPPVFTPIANGLILNPRLTAAIHEFKTSRKAKEELLSLYLQESLLIEHYNNSHPPFFPDAALDITPEIQSLLKAKSR